MPLSQTLKKLKQVKGINQVLPNNWKRYSAPEELINSSTVLFVSYVMIILITAAIFAAQFVYYSNTKETVTEVTSDSSSNEFDSCEALQADAYYGLKLTKEKCMLDGIEEPSLTSVNFTGNLGSSGSGYQYYPFRNVPQTWKRIPDKCYMSYDEYPYRRMIPFDRLFDAQTLCPGIQLDSTRCAVYYWTFANFGSTALSVYYIVQPAVNGSSDGFQTIDGITFGQINFVQRCIAYEKECATQTYKYMLSKGDECHPCYAFKDNSPFLCKKSKGKSTLEILSLSVSNTLAVFSFLVAIMPMLLTKQPEQNQDGIDA
jgi:hypothetical protein